MDNTTTSELDNAVTTWPLRRLGLRVQNMARSIDYYTKFGLSLVRDERDEQGDGSVGLGVGTREVLQLRTLPGGRPRPAHTAGLYHFALLVADEVELGSFLQNCRDQRIPLAGASDHLVSQALYLSDPEGNGIEVYADRPREQWEYEDGHIKMDTIRLNIPRLLELGKDFTGFSSHLRLGHMHLNVGDLDRSAAFYNDTLGLQMMVGIPGQADFVSWDGYHHHLGMNLWNGRNARPVEPDVYGLDFYEVKRAGLAPTTLQDPDGVQIMVL
jgi:catechol 2,3-dioxygenase